MSEVARVLGGRYAVGALLGRGGMADVHTGHDQRLGRRVAIKLLRSDVARDPVFQARFRREAQSTACLNHPAVVSVFDTGEDVSTDASGAQVRTPYIVMEHVEGRTVRDVLDDAAAAGHRGLGVQRAVEITAGVLAALQAAHDAGIVHRDVKPANVMITPSGAVKVMDFGIARALADSSVTMTQTSVVIGTARYLSPEQARGEAVDARTDLYSTGCLLYELLTGRPPFLGDSPLSVVYQHVGEPPTPPSEHHPSVGDQLDAVVLTALSKHREDRHADALAFRDALLAALAGTGPTGAGAADPTGRMPALPAQAGPGARTAPRRGRRRAAAVVVSTLAVVLALGGWLPGDATQESPGTAAARTAGSAPSTSAPSARAGTSTPVVLTAASVSRNATVPPLVGSSQEQAAAALAAAGLELGAVTPQDVAKATAGTVVSSTPAQGTAAAAGSTVALAVASGRVALDDYAGQPQDAATRALEGLGLTVATSAEPSDRPAGEVLRQSEAAGTRVAVGSAVALVVSSGPTTTSTTTTTAAPPSAAPAAPPTEGSTGSSSSSSAGSPSGAPAGQGAGQGAGQQPSADQGKAQDPSPGGAQQPAPAPGSGSGSSKDKGKGGGQGQGKAVGQGNGQPPGQSAGQGAGQGHDG